MINCSNIPDIIELKNFDSDFGNYENAVFERYNKVKDLSNVRINNLPLKHKKYPTENNRDCTFLHITTSSDSGGNKRLKEWERNSELRRLERIEWPFFILKECFDSCDKIFTWENKRKGKIRFLIWCPEIEYLIILDSRKSFYLLWTAYPVTESHRKKKLRKEYDEYIKSKNAL